MSALPVATAKEVRRQARRLTVRYPWELVTAVALHGLAAASGLVAPRLLGDLVEDVTRGIDRADRVALLICGFIAAQAVLLRFARYTAAKLGEKVLAELREEFVGNVLALPLSTVERADSGDLVTRSTRDVEVLSRTVRQAVPDTFIAVTTIVFTLGALVLVGPLLALPCLIAVPVLWAVTRWFLARARAGYLRRNASYSQLTAGLAETVQGARTVEALRIARRRSNRVDDDIARSYTAERYTLRLLSVYLPTIDTAFVLPVAATLIIGGLFYVDGLASLAAVTAATLYTQQLISPVDVLLGWLGELQAGGAAMARLLGVNRGASGQPPVVRGAATSDAGSLVVRDVSYAYTDGRDVLHHVDLVVKPGERLAIVGPSGAGKSTLGRLLAGIHPPRTGAITVDGVPLTALPLAELRCEVALVTQEHHVFRGTLRDNLVLAKPDANDEELEKILRVVDAWDWVAALGLDTVVGSGGAALSPAQAQQLALARLALADPRTLILDEATSLLDARAARHLERSLAAVLQGRTVIAIAHRLHTAHDADRVAVMEDGRITELGSHDELVASGGAYASLWTSWHGAPQTAAPRSRVSR